MAGTKIPYGTDVNDEIVLVSEIPSVNYGKRCGLVCPECGSPLLAVRSEKREGAPIHFLRHSSDANCAGTSESTIHKLAKRLFRDSIGQKFVIPSVTAYDGMGHVSRYNDKGERRFEVGGAGTSGYFEMLDSIVVMPSIECEIVGVEEEATVDGTSKTSDVVLDLSIRGKEARLPVEVRFTHAKDRDDVSEYARARKSVVEIFVADIALEKSDDVEALKARLLGLGDADYHREYLYNSKARQKVDKTWHVICKASHLSGRDLLCIHPGLQDMTYIPFYDQYIQRPFAAKINKVMPKGLTFVSPTDFEFDLLHVGGDDREKYIGSDYCAIGTCEFETRRGWTAENYLIHFLWFFARSKQNETGYVSVYDLPAIKRKIDALADEHWNEYC